MKNKSVRMLKAFKSEAARRLPFIAGIFAVLLLVGAVQSYIRLGQTARNTEDIASKIKLQGDDIRLLTEQNKALAEQNNQLAQDNKQHIDCISRLFVSFINNQGTPNNADIANCQTNKVILPAFASPIPKSSGTATGSTTGGSTAANNGPGTQDNSGQGSQNTKPLNCTVDLLGLHLGCP